ncbi:MAG: GspE/PulE family protein [Acidithiobacillus ferrivorans]
MSVLKKWARGELYGIPNMLHSESAVDSLPDALMMMGFSRQKIDFLTSYCAVSGADMGESVRDLGLGTSEKVMQAAAIRHGMPYFPQEAMDYVRADLLADYAPSISTEESNIPYVPVGIAGDGTVLVAINNGFRRQDALNRLHKTTRKVELCLASNKVLQHVYRSQFFNTRELFNEARARKHSEDRYLQMLQALLIHACFQRASDIHLLPLPGEAGAIFIRVDGVMELFSIIRRNSKGVGHDAEEFDRILQVIRMDTAAKDGQITEGTLSDVIPQSISGKYQFRVEITDTVRSPRTVIRILSVADDAAEFDDIGFDATTKKRLLHYAAQSAGMLIVTGPTGSGKTTTLNALMKTIDPLSSSIQTIENPVELLVGLWAQHHAKILDSLKSEATEWIKWFKALMRSDPDFMLFGEVRDADTTAVALDGANTGHNVFASMHTKSAPSAVQRIRNLRREGTGEPLDMDTVASTLHGILAVRLLRKLCNYCKVGDEREDTRTHMEAVHNTSPETTFYRHAEGGCPACRGKGFRGRHMVYELLHFSRHVRMLVSTNAPITELEAAIEPRLSLWGTGLDLVAKGITSIDELRRVVLEDID